MHLNITDHLADALRQALAAAGLPAPEDVFWEPTREERHGDYATNAAMTSGTIQIGCLRLRSLMLHH